MQPWRHFEWTYQDPENGNKFIQAIMNEDRTTNVSLGNPNNTKLLNLPNQDFCRKVYAYPLKEFEIDWALVPTERKNLPVEEINGEVCYEYKAKSPLVSIYTRVDSLTAENIDKEQFVVCRMVFIGGKNITFRSFNNFDENFHKDYKANSTDLCKIPPIEPNVMSNAEMIIGITDRIVLKDFFDNTKFFSEFSKLKVFKSLKLRWYSATGSSSMDIPVTDNSFTIDTAALMTKITVKNQNVDGLIDAALKDFDNLKKQDGFKRGVLIVITDKALKKSRDAGREFDHRGGYYDYNGVEMFNPKDSVNVTVFMNILNTLEDEAFSSVAATHVSMGYHYFEAQSAAVFAQNLLDMIHVIKANLTERCDTEKCNGFCDARNRCTCPMCCENDCYYTYCEASTGTCTPWPKAKPKMKLNCDPKDKCGNSQECIDGLGCIITDYVAECKPKSSCYTADCNKETGVCTYVDRCLSKRAVYDGKCYRHKCVDGECVRDATPYATCAANNDPCKEYVCGESTCSVVDKTCVKTAPYTDMDCYKAVCVAGECKIELKCQQYSICSDKDIPNNCRCNAQSDYKCVCDPINETVLNQYGLKKDEVYCQNDQSCDYTGETPKCYSGCGKNNDLHSKNCKVEFCNKATGKVETKEYNCSSKIWEVTAVCRQYVEAVCEGDNKCVLRDKETGELTGKHKIDGCKYCILDIDGSVSVTDDECKYKPASVDGATMKCDPEINECVYEEINCTAYYEEIMKRNHENCPVDSFEYKFNEKTGECSRTPKGNTPECSECKGGAYVGTCLDKFIKLNYTFETNLTDGYTFYNDDDIRYDPTTKFVEYVIPKMCMNDHCIAVPRLCGENDVGNDNCVPSTGNSTIDDKYFSDEKCKNVMRDNNFGGCKYSARYVYPKTFSYTKFKAGQSQGSDFYRIVDDVAMCEFTLERDPCGSCMMEEGKPGENHQICKVDEPVVYNNFEYLCNKEEDKCERKAIKCFTPDDKREQCLVRKVDEAYECTDEYYDLCEASKSKADEVSEKASSDKSLTCFNDVECKMIGENGDIPTCSITSNDTKCGYAYLVRVEKKTFNCTVPVGVCDPKKFVCQMKTLKEVSEDIEDYRVDENGNEVLENDMCVSYKCQDVVRPDGSFDHYWKITMDKHAEAKLKKQNCVEFKCDEETGEIVENQMGCDVLMEFPDLPPASKRCYSCKCSPKDGKMKLMVYPDTEKEEYSIDACGNCKITYKETGEVEDFNATCVLKDEVKVDGVIAGAVTVGVVVVAVTVSIVVVGIGALQTFQLVSSAMKNTVGTMNENPNFEAADKAATNSNFAG